MDGGGWVALRATGRRYAPRGAPRRSSGRGRQAGGRLVKTLKDIIFVWALRSAHVTHLNVTCVLHRGAHMKQWDVGEAVPYSDKHKKGLHL